MKFETYEDAMQFISQANIMQTNQSDQLRVISGHVGQEGNLCYFALIEDSNLPLPYLFVEGATWPDGKSLYALHR